MEKNSSGYDEMKNERKHTNILSDVEVLNPLNGMKIILNGYQRSVLLHIHVYQILLLILPILHLFPHKNNRIQMLQMSLIPSFRSIGIFSELLFFQIILLSQIQQMDANILVMMVSVLVKVHVLVVEVVEVQSEM